MIIYKNQISAEDVNKLRTSIGFSQLDKRQIESGLEGSQLVIAAYEEKVVGMARLLWDGGAVAFILDLMVLPEYKKTNLEKDMVMQILEYLHSKLQPGFGIQVDVKAWKSQISLYDSLGFVESTWQGRGRPMHICLTDQIELARI